MKDPETDAILALRAEWIRERDAAGGDRYYAHWLEAKVIELRKELDKRSAAGAGDVGDNSISSPSSNTSGGLREAALLT